MRPVRDPENTEGRVVDPAFGVKEK